MDAFNRLRAIDVGEHIEKKNGLSYLAWAWAWDKLKTIYPESYYTIYETKDGCFYFTDGKTCWVKTGVTLVDGEKQLEHIEYLPVMDMRNKSIPLANVTSFDVNKAIQRSLTKAVARHGLGLYIYAGEDLPEDAGTAETANTGHLRSSALATVTKAEPFNVGVAINRLRARLNISLEQFTAMRAALVVGGIVPDVSSKDMTQADIDALEVAIRCNFSQDGGEVA